MGEIPICITAIFIAPFSKSIVSCRPGLYKERILESVDKVNTLLAGNVAGLKIVDFGTASNHSYALEKPIIKRFFASVTGKNAAERCKKLKIRVLYSLEFFSISESMSIRF